MAAGGATPSESWATLEQRELGQPGAATGGTAASCPLCLEAS